MKALRLILPLLIVGTGLTLSLRPELVFAQEKAGPAIKWEYKSDATNYKNPATLLEALNKAGADGWELCGTINWAYTQIGVSDFNGPPATSLVLRRAPVKETKEVVALKWEYKAIGAGKPGDNAALNQLSKLNGEGWELCGNVLWHPDPRSTKGPGSLGLPIFNGGSLVLKRLQR